MAEQHRPGWASTKPGSNKYHFYDREGNSLCAYQRGAGELHLRGEDKLTRYELCTACNHPRNDQARKTALLPLTAPPVGALEVAPAVRVTVTRGHYVGRTGLVQRRSVDTPGFWWVQLYRPQGDLGDPVLLSAGQLEPVAPP